MLEKGYAAAWEDFGHPGTMQKVRRGDIVLLYANGEGIVAIGRAKGTCKEASLKDPRRLFDRIRTREWQIPVHWIVQIDEGEAYPWPKVLPPTFQNVSDDRWAEQRNELIRRYPEIVEE